MRLASLCLAFAACADTISSVPVDTVEIPDWAADAADDLGGGKPDAYLAPDPGGPPVPDPAVPEDPTFGDGPPALLLTVVEAPSYLNGSEPYTWDGGPGIFALRVHAVNATLDLVLDPKGGAPDWETLEVDCSSGVEVAPSDFEPHPTDPYVRRVVFSEERPLPAGVSVTCHATLGGAGGESTGAVAFDTALLPPHLDPFPDPDPWLVVLSRDLFEVVVTPEPDGSLSVTSNHLPAGNGLPDLEEGLAALGLVSFEAPEVAAVVRERLLEVVRGHARRIFHLDEDGEIGPESVPIVLWFEGDAGAPDPAAFDGASFSKIALGGDGNPQDQLEGTVGRAMIDWNNQEVEDDAVYGLGVFPTAIVRQVLAQPLGVALLSPLVPAAGGTPAGLHPRDAEVLAPGYDPAAETDPEVLERYDLFVLGIDLLGLALGATLCHEMGHSLGLVPSGAPPAGLFAEMPGLSFTDHFVPGAHVDTPGLNVMQTGKVTNWLEALSEEPRFNALNLAYLRRRLVVGDLEPAP